MGNLNKDFNKSVLTKLAAITVAMLNRFTLRTSKNVKQYARLNSSKLLIHNYCNCTYTNINDIISNGIFYNVRRP